MSAWEIVLMNGLLIGCATVVWTVVQELLLAIHDDRKVLDDRGLWVTMVAFSLLLPPLAWFLNILELRDARKNREEVDCR